MQVSTPKIEEISETSVTVETQIVVEAETIFDVPANGIYYANLVVTGVPVIPPTTSNSDTAHSRTPSSPSTAGLIGLVRSPTYDFR